MANDASPDQIRSAAERRFRAYLHGRGLKITRERREILAEVFSSQDHFDVRGILRRMRGKGRNVSRATVYRTVDLLVDAKLLARLEFGDGEARYELLAGRARHEHLVCTDCGRIIEFTGGEIEKLLRTVAQQHQFETDSHHVQVFGRCSRCQAERGA